MWSMEIWSKEMWSMEMWFMVLWPPYSPDANPFYFSFWVHIEYKVCTLCHANVNTMKDSANQKWDTMSPEYIRSTCKAFRRCLKAIIDNNGGYIDD